MIRLRSFVLLTVSLVLISCGTPQDRTPAIGQAFVGPATLSLRQDFSPKAPVSATMRHGEPLDILEFRRKFIRVRTAGGITGWTEVNQLLTPDQMADLRHLSEKASVYPTQGLATTFEQLNLHTEPSRNSPSFLQLPENSKVDVIGHKVTPRSQPAPPMPTPPPRSRAQRRKGKEKPSTKIPPPPMPPAPRPPSNWVQMSRVPQIAPIEKEASKAPLVPLRMDDWSLVRTKDGHVGWVLSRMVNLAIPDEVAQYAEGHRITSYFQMGDVQDDAQVKHNWLWTTIGKGPQPFEFDSFRFFIWSKRHHRYETAFIQREVVGHYPIEVKNTTTSPTFTLILEAEDGKLMKKTYTFNGYRVLFVNAESYQMPAQEPLAAASSTRQVAPEKKSETWFEKLKARLGSMTKAR